MKYLLTLTFAVLFTACVGIYNSSVFAQVAPNSNNTNTPLTTAIYSNIGSGVDVLYESPHTVILSGDVESGTKLWQALDLAKQSGYKIDAVAQVTEESSAIGNTRYLTPVYTIFLSK